jgi:uncharacterized protein YjlB
MKKNNSGAIEQVFLKDDGIFPNNRLPALFYKGILKIPPVLGAFFVKRFFKSNGWSNSWKYGIYEYNHYHSITHEVLGVISGKTILLLGGDAGVKINIGTGDVIIIPAGVAHKNLGKQDDVVCVGAYPDGMDYDINYGNTGERPQTDKNIARVPLPSKDPVFGATGGIIKYW